MSYALLIYIYQRNWCPFHKKEKKQKWSLSVFQSNPRDILNALWIDNVRLGKTMERGRAKVGVKNITWPASTWSEPALMGQVLPDLLNNRVGFAFKKPNPEQVWVGFRLYAYAAQTRPIYTYNIKKNLRP